MVAAGQGLEALCLLLNLPCSLLFEHLRRLRLPVPHNRPMRKPGAHGWSIPDTIRLIAWRIAGVHPEIIGVRLHRSASAVRAKSRRLGLHAPPRRMLHKPDPQSLLDPEPGFGWRTTPLVDQPATPQNVCARVAGVISFRTREPADSFSFRSELATGKKATAQFGDSLGQRQLPLLGIVGGTDTRSSRNILRQSDGTVVQLRQPISEFVIPKTEAEVDLNGDLSWVGKIRRPLTNKLVVWICGMLYMGGLHYAAVAKRVGMTSSAFRTFRTRTSIPVEADRKKLGNVFDEKVARETVAASGLRLRQCISASQSKDGKGNWFWVDGRDFGTRLSPTKRKRDHQIEGRYNRITILNGPDAPPPIREIHRPFARISGSVGGDRESRSAAHA